MPGEWANVTVRSIRFKPNFRFIPETSGTQSPAWLRSLVKAISLTDEVGEIFATLENGFADQC
jgi:hypothetical protein